MKPLVSLLTPVFNAMPYLKDYLESVRKQTWRPLQLILADDGSTDDSAAYIESILPELEKEGIETAFLKLPHQGQAWAMNAALKKVSGVFLTWCDSDDIMLPECIEKKAQYLLDHPEIGMVRNDGLHIDGDTGEVLRNSAREVDRHTQWIFHDLFLQYTYCYAGCYMIRTDLFEECYPDREIPVSPEGQNLQMLLPPASRTECGFIPDVLHHYLQRTSGHASQSKSYTQRRARIINFSKLFREILPYCECDREQYEAEIKRVEKTQLDHLNFSVVYRAREEMKKK